MALISASAGYGVTMTFAPIEVFTPQVTVDDELKITFLLILSVLRDET